MAIKPDQQYTPEEYIDMERKSHEKNDYFRGEIFCMAGSSRTHHLITLNIAAGLHRQLIERDCEVYASDMRVKVSTAELFTYPDVVVVCGPADFEDDVHDTLLNPNVIFEVLSKSTEAYDRGPKFAHFRRLAPLREFILVHQDSPHVEHYARQSGTSWMLREYREIGNRIDLTTIECGLNLDEIYAKTGVG